MTSSRFTNIFGALLALFSFVFLLLVNLGTNVIHSFYIMKTESHNITRVFGLYGSCLNSGTSFHIQSLVDCAKDGGLINDFGSAGTKFLVAMHPIALILSFVLVVIGVISIFNSENGLLQNLFTIVSIIGTIIIILAIIGDILVFHDDNSILDQFEENTSDIASGSITKKSFGPGFGLIIAALAFTTITICIAFSSRTVVVKVEQKRRLC